MHGKNRILRGIFSLFDSDGLQTKIEERRKKMKDRTSDEIYLIDYLHAIWKRKLLIIITVAASVLATAVYSLFMKDVYQAKAVISPITDKPGGEGLAAMAQQFGGIAGIGLPTSASTSEIMNLLNSNVLRERVARKYRLLPVLFPEQWDEEKKAWKKAEGGLSLNLSSEAMKRAKGAQAGASSDGPSMWDAIRMLEGVMSAKNNPASNTITLSAEFPDPELASALVNYFLVELVEHMSEESKKMAGANARYLENLLKTTADPIIRQKVYNLLTQQIEISMMAEMKENFAFKVIDPSRPPDVRIRPKKKHIVFLSLVISMFASVILALFIEHVKLHWRGSGR